MRRGPWISFGLALLASGGALLLADRVHDTVEDPWTVGAFLHLFVRFDLAGAYLTLGLLAAALLLPLGGAARAAARGLARHPLPAAGGVYLGLAVASLTIYHAHPLAMDEYVAWFQARIFAAGRLTAQVDPYLLDWIVPPPFFNHFIMASRETGRMLGAYWPGFSLLMAPFALLEAGWACNPLLAAGALLLTQRIGRRMFDGDETATGFAMLALLASPAFTVNAISFYAMNAHLALNLLFAWLLLAPSWRRCLAAGLVGSFGLILHNPFPHLLFALPWGVALLLRRGRMRHAPALLAGYLPIALAVGVGWVVLRGQFLREAAGAAAGPEAGAATGLWERFRAVAWWRVFVLPDIGLLWARLLATVKLWVWAVPGLPLLAAIGAWRCRRRPGAALLFLSFVLTFAGYLFIPFTQGHGWGYRYAHSAFGALPLLAAGALYGARGGQSDRRAWWRIWGGAAVLSLLLATTLRFVQVESFIDRHLAQIPARGVEGRMVIFLRPDRGYYPLDLIQNDPFLRNRRLRFLSQGAARNRELLDRYFPGARPLPPEEGGRAWRLGERSDVRRLR